MKQPTEKSKEELIKEIEELKIQVDHMRNVLIETNIQHSMLLITINNLQDYAGKYLKKTEKSIF